MINIDMWYNDKIGEADRIDIVFYPNSGVYRGNIYKNDRTIGDYTCSDSTELEKAFEHLNFNWN